MILKARSFSSWYSNCTEKPFFVSFLTRTEIRVVLWLTFPQLERNTKEIKMRNPPKKVEKKRKKILYIISKRNRDFSFEFAYALMKIIQSWLHSVGTSTHLSKIFQKTLSKQKKRKKKKTIFPFSVFGFRYPFLENILFFGSQKGGT